MTPLGKFVKQKAPKLYHFLVNIIIKIKAQTTPYMIYITDDLGGSFKTYFSENNMNAKLSALKSGLDEQSIQCINVVYERLKFYPDKKNKQKTHKSKPIKGGLLSVETQESIAEISESLQQKKNKIKLSGCVLDESVFYFYHGLTELPASVRKFLKNTHFLDIGAFVGDSAIALQEYNYSKIFSIEISQKSIEKYKQNMQANGVDYSKYQLLNYGVSAEDNLPDITINDTGSAGFSIQRDIGNYDSITIKQKTLDTIVDEYNIQPKFIKADIEGFGIECIKGGKQTLINHRPVISLAIYHNPYEFFEAKPLLESFLDDYSYRIVKLSSGVQNNLIHSEVILLAYPNELNN